MIVRKWFLRMLMIGGAAGVIGALVMASRESTR
jgi:hypothetical protein